MSCVCLQSECNIDPCCVRYLAVLSTWPMLLLTAGFSVGGVLARGQIKALSALVKVLL